jgi:hypothetical protein
MHGDDGLLLLLLLLLMLLLFALRSWLVMYFHSP